MPRSWLPRPVAPALGLLVLAVGASLSAPVFAAPFVIKSFWRGDSLPPGTYIRTEGHPGGGGQYWPCDDTPGGACGLDITAVRWDSETKRWSTLRADARSEPTSRDHAFWGVPLYSPVDGEVIACWRSIPDDMELSDPDPAIADTPRACRELSTGNCLATGNHIVIKTADGHDLVWAHLQQDSIPFELCPIPDDLVEFPMPFQGSPSLCGDSGVAEMARLARLLPGRPLPRVSEGDLIGRGGESGQSGGPHTHFSMGIVEEDNGVICRRNILPRFSETWQQVRTPDVAPTAKDWSLLAGEPLSIALDYATSLILFGGLAGPVDPLEVDPSTGDGSCDCNVSAGGAPWWLVLGLAWRRRGRPRAAWGDEARMSQLVAR